MTDGRQLAGVEPATGLAPVARLRRDLAAIKTPAEALGVMDRSARLRDALRLMNHSVEQCNEIAEIYLLATRKFGGLVKRGPGAPEGNSNAAKQSNTDVSLIPGTQRQRQYARKVQAKAEESAIKDYVRESTKQHEQASIAGLFGWLDPDQGLLTANWRQHVAAVDDDVESNVVLGDFREACADLADESVDLVFCDPPYDRASVGLYADAAVAAMRVLRPGGSFMAYAGHYLLPEILAGCTNAGLRYWWLNAVVYPDQNARMTEYCIVVHWKPIVWFVKGTRGDKLTFVDDVAPHSDAEKDTHQWQQPVEEASYYIARLSSPRGLVVDFFCGGGTTAIAADRLGRPWRTYELNEATRDSAVGRIQIDRNTRESTAG